MYKSIHFFVQNLRLHWRASPAKALQAKFAKGHLNRHSEVIYVCLEPGPDKSKSHIDCVSD